MIQDLLDATRGASNTGAIVGRALKYFARTSVKALSKQDEVSKRKDLIQIVSDTNRDAVDRLGFEVKVVGYDAERMKNENFLMIGNHLSYFDILITSRTQPTLFVTSVDMGQAPLLGQITRLAGCIFVERRNRSQIGRDIGTITDALNSGFQVMVYPEGTSGDGKGVLPFKKSLFSSAVEAQKDILPVCIKYTEIDGEPFSEKNADKICWYGDMSFGPHFLNLMKLKSLKAELHFLDPIKVTKESHRQELAEKTYNVISACYSER